MRSSLCQLILASYVVFPFTICIISNAFASICLENQQKCLSTCIYYISRWFTRSLVWAFRSKVSVQSVTSVIFLNCQRGLRAEQFMWHLTVNNLHSHLQLAHKQQQSMETALYVKNDILMSMNEQHVTLLVFFDLCATLDTVHHDKLIK